MKDKPTGNSSEETVFAGRLFEIVHQEQSDGRNFEIARRAPNGDLYPNNSKHEQKS